MNPPIGAVERGADTANWRPRPGSTRRGARARVVRAGGALTHAIGFGRIAGNECATAAAAAAAALSPSNHA